MTKILNISLTVMWMVAIFNQYLFNYQFNYSFWLLTAGFSWYLRKNMSCHTHTELYTLRSKPL